MPSDINVLDHAILDGLRNMLGAEKLSELIDGFLERAEEIVHALQNPETSDHFDKAHELKGMAANYGFPELSAIARGLEDKIQNEAPLDAQIKELPEAYQRAQKAIDDWFKF